MKRLFLIATLFAHYIAVVGLKLLDSLTLIIAILIVSLIVGGLLKFSKNTGKKDWIMAIGWGLFYGSITSILLVTVFMIWLSFMLNNN